MCLRLRAVPASPPARRRRAPLWSQGAIKRRRREMRRNRHGECAAVWRLFGGGGGGGGGRRASKSSPHQTLAHRVQRRCEQREQLGKPRTQPTRLHGAGEGPGERIGGPGIANRLGQAASAGRPSPTRRSITPSAMTVPSVSQAPEVAGAGRGAAHACTAAPPGHRPQPGQGYRVRGEQRRGRRGRTAGRRGAGVETLHRACR